MMEVLWVSGESWFWEVLSSLLRATMAPERQAEGGKCWEMRDLQLVSAQRRAWGPWVGEAQAA